MADAEGRCPAEAVRRTGGGTITIVPYGGTRCGTIAIVPYGGTRGGTIAILAYGGTGGGTIAIVPYGRGCAIGTEARHPPGDRG